jgi:hypothetical protein
MKINLLYAISMLVALTACSAGNYTNTNPNDYDLQDMEKDSAFLAAIQAGKSIVVMSNTDLRKKYPDKESIDSNSATRTSAKTGNYKTDVSAYVQWIDLENTKKIITSGHLDLPESLENTGPQLDLTANSTGYQIFIVEPGNYGASYTGYELPRSLPPSSSRGPHKKSTIGVVSFEKAINTEMEATQVWQSAVYGTRTEEYEECVAVHVTGGCVEVGYFTQDVDYIIKPAGYYEQLYPVSVIGSKVSNALLKPFATLSIAPGEVLLVDGLYAESPNIRFDLDSCRGEEGRSIKCELSQISLKLSPAKLEDLKFVNFIENGYPKLAALLSKIEYRSLTIRAHKTSMGDDQSVEYTVSTD